jgi:hypothetical protein
MEMTRSRLPVRATQAGEWCQRVGTKVRKAAGGYVFGDLVTSLSAGIVIGITMREAPSAATWDTGPVGLRAGLSATPQLKAS